MATPGSTGPRARVLLVMGEPLARFVAFTLRHASFETTVVPNVASAGAALLKQPWDLLLIEIDRHADAIELARQAREPPSIIGMTRRRDTSVKLSTFLRGVDDMIEVPFTPDEILARSIAVLRRVRGIDIAVVPSITFGDLEVNVMEQTVRVADSQQVLTPVEHTILYLLAANTGTSVSHQAIRNTLSDDEDVLANDVVDRYVGDIVEKLGRRGPHFRVEAVSNDGYCFLSPPLSDRPA